MRINRDSTAWAIVCGVILAVAGACYIPYASRAQHGPSGGSFVGLIYAGVGSAMMLFVMLLGPRRFVRTWSLGRAQWWLRGHIWIGLISYPIILFHAGFRWGGPLTSVIMWLFTLVVASGVIGLLVQQFVPRLLYRDVKMETIYEQIDVILARLRKEAAELVRGVRAAADGEVQLDDEAGGLAVAKRASTEAYQMLRSFHETSIDPFLQSKMRMSALSTSEGANFAFTDLRNRLPAEAQPALASLQRIVEERRQLATQVRMYHWLHAWLFVHVPLSYALVLLAAYHAFFALRFASLAGIGTR